MFLATVDPVKMFMASRFCCSCGKSTNANLTNLVAKKSTDKLAVRAFIIHNFEEVSTQKFCCTVISAMHLLQLP